MLLSLFIMVRGTNNIKKNKNNQYYFFAQGLNFVSISVNRPKFRLWNKNENIVNNWTSYREFPIVLCELFLIVFVINFRFLFLHSPERQSKTDYRYRVQIFPDLQDRRPRYWLAQREGMNEEGSWYSDVGLRRCEFSNPIMSMFWTAQSEDYQIFSVWQKSLNLLKVCSVNSPEITSP